MQTLRHLACWFIIFSISANAQEGLKNIEKKGEMTCIHSNGFPNHKIGKFPNRDNPNKFKEQELTFCFPTIPQFTQNVTYGFMTVGVSVSGIPFRPYTAEYFDENAKRGFSKNPSSGWRKQAMYKPRSLGIDSSNGHVDRSGLYHYHSTYKNSYPVKENILLGYAPDGFKIAYNASMISSWQLKPGVRLSSPGGPHDRQFEEDFEYRAQNGPLDECNGKKVNGVYTYFATDFYPFFPRCF